MATHRISLRGPWTIDRRNSLGEETSLVSRRQFHSPPPFLNDPIAPNLTLKFVWQANLPAASIRFNQISLDLSTIETVTFDPASLENASAIPVASIDLGKTFLRFNTLELFWVTNPADQVTESQAIMDLVSTLGLNDGQSNIRYQPGPHHPLHIDSWLEILE